MTSDCELLRRYSETSAEDAFAELVRRHVDLVYSTALRQVNGDAHFAEDVAQSVFTHLARQARALSGRPVLTGWLYTTACFTAAKVARTEHRRRHREHEAQAMHEQLRETSPGLDWNRLRPVLDEAMRNLKEPDREAILLRFFENRQHADIGLRLGVSENTARMRIGRALEKLRAQLARRGWTTTAATLATAISANAVQVAPAGLAAALTSGSMAGVAAGTGTSLTLLKFMATTKLKLGLGALAFASVATILITQHLSQASWRAESEVLRQQLAQLQADNENLSNRLARSKRPGPRLPAPAVQPDAARASFPSADDAPPVSLYERYKDKQPKLTAAQVEPYLKENKRNAASLLAAFRTSGDPALLEEAKQKFPNDPQVAFEAAFKKDISPEEHRQWVETMKRSDPNNPLPNYLSALDHFKAGQTDQAVQEFVAASGKSQFQDYTLDRVQNDEEAFRAAGYSMAESKTIPAQQLLLPQLAQVKEAGLQMVNLANSYRQAGDEASAQSALQMTASLGQRYGNVTPGEPEISQLVGIAIEQIALNKLDPNSPSAVPGQTVQDQLNELQQKKSSLKDLNQQLDPLLPQLSDQDWISYKDRWRMFGEESAIRWVVGKYGSK